MGGVALIANICSSAARSRTPIRCRPISDKKEYEYFVLCRDPEISPDGDSKAVTGEDLLNAGQSSDSRRGGLAVSFTFNAKGGQVAPRVDDRQ